MKTSLLHLPQKKQFEINRIAELIREVVNPEMIILFGSYAKGKQVEHTYRGGDGILYEYISDYDFLVVVNKVTEETSDQEWVIEERAEIYEPPVNLEIHEVDFINNGLETGQYFFTDIIKEGIVLFDTGNVKFAEPRELTPVEAKQIAKDYYDTWYPQGMEFIIDGTHALNRKSFKKAAFELHQAAESFYYGTLLVFTSYKPKTHNLKKLRRKSKHLSEDLFLLFPIETSKTEKHLFDLLKRAYIEARYKRNYVIVESEAIALLERVQKMSDIVRQICEAKIESIS